MAELNPILEPHQTSHISPSWASYWVSTVMNLENIDRVITSPGRPKDTVARPICFLSAMGCWVCVRSLSPWGKEERLPIYGDIIWVCSTSKETSHLAPLTFCATIHQWVVNSPHKGSVVRKVLPCRGVIMGCYKAIRSIYIYMFYGGWMIGWVASKDDPVLIWGIPSRWCIRACCSFNLIFKTINGHCRVAGGDFVEQGQINSIY